MAIEIRVKALTEPQVVFDTSRKTQGFTSTKESLELFEKLLIAEHSPIRNLLIQIDMLSIPYYVQVHLVRHKIGVEHFVRTQRPDAYNPVMYDRENAPQGAPINHTMVLNAQAIISISRKRLCTCAYKTTRNVWEQVKAAFLGADDPYLQIIGQYMLPECGYRRGFCPEFSPCGVWKTYWADAEAWKAEQEKRD